MKAKPAKDQLAAAPRRLSSPWRLLRSAWTGYRAHLGTYLLVTSIIVIPINILSLSQSLSADAGFSAYVTIATILMNLALIYTITRIAGGEPAPRLRQAYYDGTAAFVRFILISLVLALTLLPAAIGVIIYLAATAANAGVAVSAGEATLIALIGLIVAIPSFWLLTRYIFGYYALLKHDVRPVAALKLSREVSLGRFWKVFGRLALFAIFMLIIAFLLALLPVLLALVYHDGVVLGNIFQVLFSLIVLPLANLYMVRLFDELEKVPAE